LGDRGGNKRGRDRGIGAEPETHQNKADIDEMLKAGNGL